MTAPERIWACQSGPMVGLFVSSWSGPDVPVWPRYTRTDLHTAERDARIAALEAALAEASYGLTWAKAQIRDYHGVSQIDLPPIDRASALIGPLLKIAARALLDGGKA